MTFLRAVIYQRPNPLISLSTLPVLLDFPINKVTINKQARQLDTYSFSASIDAINTQFPIFQDLLLFVDIYYGERLIVWSAVLESYQYSTDSNEIEFTADNILILLAQYRNISQLRPVAQHVIGMFNFLIRGISNVTFPVSFLTVPWTINLRYAHRLNSPVTALSVDLRNLGNILSIYNKVIDSSGDFFFRQSTFYELTENITDTTAVPFGAAASPFNIALGRFDNETGWEITEENITSLRIDKKVRMPLRAAVPIGRDYTVNGVPTQLLLDGLPTTTQIETYSVSVNSIIDTAYTEGSSQALFFPDIAAGNSVDPTAGQLLRARRTLYRRAIREMKSKSDLFQWNIGIEGNSIPFDLQIGNRVRVNVQKQITFYDEFGSTINPQIFDSLAVNGEYFIKALSLTYTPNKVSGNVTLTDRFNFDQENPNAFQVRTAKSESKADNSFQTLPDAPRYGFYTVSIPTGLPANCTNGRSVTVAKITSADFGEITTLPVNATIVKEYRAYCEDPAVTVVFTTPPQTSVANFVMCVSRNGNWTVNDSATIYVYVRFCGLNTPSLPGCAEDDFSGNLVG